MPTVAPRVGGPNVQRAPLVTWLIETRSVACNYHHVRVGDVARRVELEGFEDEGAPEQVVTDDHATLAEARLGDERVRRTQVARGHLVGRHLWHALPHGG
jgi:hypothetical protein